MKILLLSPNQRHRYNRSHQLFRDEFKNHHDVVYFGEGFPNYNPRQTIPEVVKEYGNFDLILTYGLKYTLPFLGIGEIKNIPKVHITVDYFPIGGGSFERNHNLFKRDKYDLYFGVVGHEVRNLVKNGVCKKAFLLPFSIDTNIYKNFNLTRDIDIFSVFTVRNEMYPNRDTVQKLIREMKDITTFTKKVERDVYIGKINRSKIFVTSNDKWGSLNIKYYESMSCGTMILADKPEDLNDVGFVDGKHLVIYKDLNDLKEKIKFYLSHNKEREEISKTGMEFVRENHNNSIRVQQFTKIIQEQLGVK